MADENYRTHVTPDPPIANNRLENAMRSLQIIFSFAIATLAYGIMAVSSNAAAISLLFLGAETVPVTATVENTTSTNEIQNAAEILTGKGLKLQLSFVNTAGEGNYKAWLLNVIEPSSGVKCSTSGDAEGSVLIAVGGGTEAAKLVYDALTPILGVADLLNVDEFEIVCGTHKVKLKGELLALITTGGGGQITTFKYAVHCSKTIGEPTNVKYWLPSTGEERTALLLMNAGTGYKKACIQLEGEAGEVTLSLSKMVEIMG